MTGLLRGTQLGLFEAPPEKQPYHDLPPHQRHSQTSKEAAVAIEPHLNALQKRVLAFIKQKGSWGATDEEGTLLLNMNPSTYRPRRIELADLELIEKRGTRPTRSKREADVWVAVKR